MFNKPSNEFLTKYKLNRYYKTPDMQTGEKPDTVKPGTIVAIDNIECLVFSAFKSNKSDLDNLAHDYQLEKWLIKNDIDYKKLIGVYEGVRELSFIIKSYDYETKLKVINKCKEYKQDTVLLLEKENAHQKRPAWFLILDKELPIQTRYVGLLQEVSEKEAKEAGDYTFDDKFNQYYIIK